MKRFFVCVLALLLSSTISFAGEKLVIKGSTTVLPIAQKAAETYMNTHPGVSISVSGGGSGTGIKAILDGIVDIADSSREVKPEEFELAKEKGMILTVHPIALDAVVPVVNPKNPVENLTLKQLHDIYTGKIKNWKEVGGKNRRIVVVSRDSSSGTFEVWSKKVMHEDRVTPRALLQASNGAVREAVAKNEDAIGYIGLGYVNKQIKPVSIDGVTGSRDSVRKGKYPVSRILYMITSDRSKQPVSYNFIGFVLSSAGQQIVQQEGFIKLR